MREIATSQMDSNPCSKPFLQCLSWDSLALLDAALYFNEKQHVFLPAKADIMEFNPSLEMVKTPRYSREVMR